MQHDRGCICQECSDTSTTDTVLVGLLIITGVVIAITTASKWFVAGAIVVLIAMVVRKLRVSMPRGQDDGDGSQPKKGLG